jgi:hypothetical protein
MMRVLTGFVAFLLVALPVQPSIEQTSPGTKPAARLVASFDGMGVGFEGPQGRYEGRNPSDNSLAVGPDHIVQTVNSRIAIFTKKGKRYGDTGRALYGPVNTNTVFAGFGGPCEARNNGDAVVRYDQLANRWLVTMPIFSRIPLTEVGERPAIDKPAPPGQLALPGQASSPGAAAALPPNPAIPPPPGPPQGRGQRGAAGAQGGQPPPPPPPSTYGMCYAISTGPDPMGTYYRYAFERPLFPDYPRPAIWTDGYYVPTSSSDNRISDTIATQKHACVVDRAKMLKGEPASEQCQVVLNVNFLNNADIDGTATPPPGAPNVMIAAGGTQLDNILDAATIDTWRFHVDWQTPANTKLVGPEKIAVAPYHYLCNGQLTNCVPQPDTDRGLDAQGDKIMSRVVYRRIGDREAIVAVHSVNAASGGGVRWYELVVDKARAVSLAQQGTYAPGGFYRWMASPAIDRFGNIGIGYSFGGAPNYAGQRFAARQKGDPPGVLTLKETVLAEGEASQTGTLRWEDYTTTAIDPSDDCTVWYVGDYLKKGAASYSSRIGAFQMPGCGK